MLLARKRDGKKIMEAFSLFEEEHIQPDRGVLSYVAKVLQELKLPVPFEIPQVHKTSHQSLLSKLHFLRIIRIAQLYLFRSSNLRWLFLN